ncbi:MAG: hypothetical protein ACON4A_01390 [Flavobacteriaceae bacterium]
MIPKSIFRKGYTYLFLCLSGLVFPIHILSQTPQAGIASQPDQQDGIVISCAGGAMSFTGFQGGLFDAPKSYAFFVIRAGDTLVGRPRADANVWDQLIAGNEVLDTDQVFVRAFDEDTATGGGNFSDSQPLQLDIRPIPTPTLLSDTPANVFCDGQLVRFTTLPDTAGLLYSFFVNDILMQGPGAVNVYTSEVLDDGDVVRVVVNHNGCEGESSLQMEKNDITDAGQIAFDTPDDPFQIQTICFGETPPLLVSNRPGAINGTALDPTNNQYQWYVSTDGVSWEAIDDAHAQNYQPEGLTSSVFFRRDVLSVHNGNACFLSSNILQVNVTESLDGGTMIEEAQTVCADAQPQMLRVDAAQHNQSTNYQWQFSLDGIHFNDVVTAGTAVNYQPPLLSQTTYYRRISSILEGRCTAISSIHTIHVIELDPGAIDPNHSTTLCFGETPALAFGEDPLAAGNPGAPAVSNGLLAFQWEQSTNFGASWEEIPNATQNHYSAGPLEQTTWFRRKVRSTLNALVCESISENRIEITVEPSIHTGWIETEQIFCRGTLPQPLVLREAIPEQAGIVYALQWQQAIEDGPFEDIPGQTGTTLTFTAGAIWWTDTTSTYRVVITATGAIVCQAMTEPVTLTVFENHYLEQVVGPDSQTICPGEEMIPISFEFGNGATQLVFPDELFHRTDIQMAFDPEAQRWTLSGRPTSSLLLEIVTAGNQCEPVALSYELIVSPRPALPGRIFVDGFFLKNGGSPFQFNEHTLCEGTPTSQLSANFFDPEATTYTDLEWELAAPLDAATVDRNTGRVTWRTGNDPFHGTATFRVRGTSCGVVTAWTEFDVVVEEQVFPPPELQALDEQIQAIQLTTCQITTDTPPTQFFIPGPDGGPSTGINIRWSIEPLTGGSPGHIGATSGALNWNVGFSGTFNVHADPTDCHGQMDPNLRVSRTVQIEPAPIGEILIFLGPGQALPSCPGETAGFITDFDSSEENLNWSIDNALAGTIARNTGVLRWNPDFFGRVVVRAETGGLAQHCETNTNEVVINIVGPPEITLTSGINSNITEACINTAIQTITYALEGAAQNAVVNGLPIGVDVDFMDIPQQTEIRLNGTSAGAGERYTLSIGMNQYAYTTQSAGESEAQLVNALLNLLQTSTVVHAVATTDQEGIVLTGTNGAFEVTTAVGGTQPQLSFTTPHTIQMAERLISLGGTVDDAPGEYNFEVQTTAEKEACTSAVAVGKIFVRPNASINLLPGTDEHPQVCDAAPINPIVYTIDNALDAFVELPGEGSINEGLPNGLMFAFSNQQLVLSGIPDTGITTDTTYTYIIRTTNSRFGCEEATHVGQITVRPNLNISLATAAYTQNQTVCESTPIEETIYQLNASPFGNNFDFNFGDLPPGITAVFDEVNNRFILNGTPELDPPLQAPQDFAYSFTITSCQATTFTLTGTLRVLPQSTINLSSDPGTDAQTVCDLEPWTPIEYQMGNAATFTYTITPPAPWFVPTLDPTNGRVFISGTPDVDREEETLYTYTITPLGNPYDCSIPQAITGTLRVVPAQQVQLQTALATTQQVVCSGTAITPIVYTWGRSATGVVINGLPPGIVVNYDTTLQRVTLSGTPDEVLVNTDFEYTVTTTGPGCTTQNLNGLIQVTARPGIEIHSNAGTDNQTGHQAVCEGQAINPIQYRLSGSAESAMVEGLPNNVSFVVENDIVTISGQPFTGAIHTRIFNYTITSIGGCEEQAQINGQIEVHPLPRINQAFILENDLSPVSCFGAQDGAIRIPEESPAFDQRISGNQNAIRQVDHLVFENDPHLSDVFTLEIDQFTFTHTVIPNGVGGPPQNLNQVLQVLVDQINTSTEVSVNAALQGNGTLVLTAKTAGVPFAVHQITVLPNTTPTQHTLTPVVANRSSNYSFSWSGPNGFSSSVLAIENLAAGTYELTVMVNDCISETAVFEITEPAPMEVDIQMCNSALEATVLGGTAPFTFEIFDHNGNLLDTQVNPQAVAFQNLIPGANYLLIVTDARCSVTTQIPIELPFSLSFDRSIPVVSDDYCNDDQGSGSIVLGDAVEGGSGQFEYQWVGPDGTRYNTKDIDGLLPGLYELTLTDAVLGCTQTELFEIASVTPLVIAVTPDTPVNPAGDLHLSCDEEADTFIEIVAQGGLGNYSYAWTRDGEVIPGATAPKIENLTAGVYEVFVVDLPPTDVVLQTDPCIQTRSFVVHGVDPIVVHVEKTTDAQYCPGDVQGAIELEILGGRPPFTVLLNDGDAGSFRVEDHLPTTLDNLNPVADGPEYTITVEDAEGCQPEAPIDPVIFDVVAPMDFRVEVQQIDCTQGILGSISLELISGDLIDPDQIQVEWISANAHYYHTWESHNGLLDDLSTAGNYTVVVTQGACELFRAGNIILEDINDQQLYFKNINVNEGGCNGEQPQIALELAGGSPPYQIYWEKFEVVVSQNTSGTASGTATTSDSTATTGQWVRLSHLNNNAIAQNLAVGTYRATVEGAQTHNDANGCVNSIQTQPIIIGAPAYELRDFDIESPKACNAATGFSLRFSIYNQLTNTLSRESPPQIRLDNVLISTPQLVQYNSTTYGILDVDAGEHTLNINTGNVSETCSIIHPFTIDALEPISYRGNTAFTIDFCETFTQLIVDTQLVSGGVPFEVNAQLVYDYQWHYTPLDGGLPTSFVGPEINTAYPGSYELIIEDQNGCQSDVIHFTVEGVSGAAPFTVAGALRNSTTEDAPEVKVIPPTCEGDFPDGQIGVTISGGARPYTIQWYREEVAGTSSPSQQARWIALEAHSNATRLNGLASGKYKLVIQSQGQTCPEDAFSPYVYYEETLKVPPSVDFYVVEGPFPDTNLCKGDPGFIALELFERNGGVPTFYYNDQLLSVTNSSTTQRGVHYTLYVDEPTEKGGLKIVSSAGCLLTVEFDVLELALPAFEFSSPSYAANEVILAREEITFNNISAQPYVYSEWIFGDGSPTQQVLSGAATPVRHTYGISGTYFVTLRNYNALGCSTEISQAIEVGKGYYILAPNVFTPNDDLINDRYKVLLSGFSSVDFSIYDSFGNPLYHESRQEEDPEGVLQGILIEGWDGSNATGAPFYIYVLEGVLLDGETEVEHSGVFSLLK